MQQSGVSYITPPAFQPQEGVATQPTPSGYPQHPAQGYSLPGAQGYAQPGPQGYAPQGYAPPAPQAYAQPSAQAAPVPPVAFPGQGGGQGSQQQAPQSPQQAYARQLVGVARQLEQAMPGYHLLSSYVLELAALRAPEGLPAVQEALEEATFLHAACLGAIRRFLAGESNAGVVTTLATHTNALLISQTKLKPFIEGLVVGGHSAGILSQMVGIAASLDTLIAQTGSATQNVVGQHVWEAARSQPVKER